MPAKKKKTNKKRSKTPQSKKVTKARSLPKKVAKNTRPKVRNTKTAGIFKSSYETWITAQVAKRSRESSSSQTGYSRGSVMPKDTFSTWLSKQQVSAKEEKLSQRGPPGTYESWLQRQVEVKRSTPEEVTKPNTATITVEEEEELTASGE